MTSTKKYFSLLLVVIVIFQECHETLAQASKQRAASAEVNKELMSTILNNAPDAVADLMNVLVKMVLKPWDWRDDVCGGRTNKPITPDQITIHETTKYIKNILPNALQFMEILMAIFAKGKNWRKLTC